MQQMMRRDPAPTRWAYRLERLMLTPVFRKLLRVGLPSFLIVFFGGVWLSSEANRQSLTDTVAEIRASIEQRPEFRVDLMAIDGADDRLQSDIREVVAVDFPVSSFDLDLEEMRGTITAINAVAEARLQIRSGGVLQVNVTQRDAVAVWRDAKGLKLVDEGGHLVRPIAARADRADLPLVVGDGARDAIAEALELTRAAAPLQGRVRGLVRMGERRWDLVLDRDQRILLPTDRPVRALERVIALHQARDLLGRDIAVVDMRNPGRPTIRLNDPALASLRTVTQQQQAGADE